MVCVKRNVTFYQGFSKVVRSTVSTIWRSSLLMVRGHDKYFLVEPLVPLQALAAPLMAREVYYTAREIFREERDMSWDPESSCS